MDMIHLPPDFKEFFQLLSSAKVDYLLVGGYAVVYHGYPRTTGDIDIWIATSPENSEKMVTVLKQFGFGDQNLSPEIFLKENQIIRMGVPPLRIEILTSASGVHFESCFAKRIVETIDGVQINILSLQYLKKNKKAAGRTKDLNDLQNLP